MCYVLYFYIFALLVNYLQGTPNSYCSTPLNTKDCGRPPIYVFSYYLPASRCEIEMWRGCPTVNKFPTEAACIDMCIARQTKVTDSSENKIPEGSDSPECEVPDPAKPDPISDEESGSIESSQQVPKDPISYEQSGSNESSQQVSEDACNVISFNYFYSEPGFGWFKLHKKPQFYDIATKTCREEGSKLVPVKPYFPWIKAVVVDILIQNDVKEIYVKHNSDSSDAHGYNVFNRFTGLWFDKTEPRAFICYRYGFKDNIFGNCTNFPESDYIFSQQAGGWLKFHSLPATFDDARNRCHLEGALLASPLNSGLALEMTTLADRNGAIYFFTGIHASFPKAFFVSTEGVRLNAIPSINGHPPTNNFHNEERCVVMTVQGMLWDVPCGNMYQFICYKKQMNDNPETTIPTTTIPTTTIPIKKDCGTTDRDYKMSVETGSCYKVHRRHKTWSRAFATCLSEGSHLVVINSQKEAQFVSSVYSAVEKRPRAWAHIGFMWGENGSWVTIFGQTLKEAGYVKWARNEPNNVSRPLVCEHGEYCGSVNFKSELNDIACNAPLSFICERKAKNLNRPASNDPADKLNSLPTISTKCSTDYEQSDLTGNCYKFHRIGQSWHQALATCEAEGGYLAVINSVVEAELLKNLFKRFPPEKIAAANTKITMLGFSRNGNNSDWRTVHGQTLQEAGYDHWAVGEPKGENCGAMYRSARLDDVNCNFNRSFICEMEPYVQH